MLKNSIIRRHHVFTQHLSFTNVFVRFVVLQLTKPR